MNTREAPTPIEQSIAVLPFDDLSPEGDQQYFVEGLSEEIINALTQIPDLKVAARTSTFILAEENANIEMVASALGVANVLEGSVRKSGDQVRITAQLIEAESGFHLWSETFDRELTDIFQVQDEIARAIAAQLQVTLSGEQQTQLVAESTESTEAYEAYLLGRHFWSQRTPESLQAAVSEFERAIELDPDYAEAYSGLADSYNVWELYANLRIPPDFRELARQAVAAAQRAVDLAPNLGMAHTSLARALMKGGGWEEASREFEIALRLSPGYATAHHWYGIYLWYTGTVDAGVARLRQAVRLDPVSQPISTVLGMALVGAERVPEGVEELRRATALDPGWPSGWQFLGLGLLAAGEFEEAVDAFIRATELLGVVPDELAPREALEALIRYRETGELRPLPASVLEIPGPFPLFLSAYVGQREFALVGFEAFVRAGAYEMAAGGHVVILADLLGNDSRYQALLQEAGITW